MLNIVFIRYFILKTYEELTRKKPRFNYVLFEGNFNAPYTFEQPVCAIAISPRGNLIAFSHHNDSK